MCRVHLVFILSLCLCVCVCLSMICVSFIEIANSVAFEVINLCGLTPLHPSKSVPHLFLWRVVRTSRMCNLLYLAGDRARQIFQRFQVEAHLLLLLELGGEHSCLQLRILHIVCVLAGFLLLFEVVKTGAYRLFVHGYALFENVERARDDVQLWDDLFEGQSKFFPRASHTTSRGSSRILGQKLLVSVVVILSQFCRTFSTLVAVQLRSWGGRTGGPSGTWSWLGGLGCSWSICARVFKAWHFVELFSFDLVEVWLPDHDHWVGSRGGKKVTTGWKRASRSCSFVPKQTEEDVSLAQIPNFDRAVGWGRQEVATVRVERNLVDRIICRIVVLDESLRANIPNFDCVVSGAGCNTGAIRVELHRIGGLTVIVERVNECFRSDVPQFYGRIFRTWTNEACVRGELGWLDPVSVRIDGEHKLAVDQLVNLEHLVLGTGQKKRPVLGERNWAHRSRMTLDHLRESFDRVLPNADCVITRTRHNRLTIRRHCHVMHWPFVSHESERSHHGFEVPDHDCAVERSGDNLAQIGVEGRRGDPVFVAFERAAQGRICDLATHEKVLCGAVTSSHGVLLLVSRGDWASHTTHWTLMTLHALLLFLLCSVFSDWRFCVSCFCNAKIARKFYFKST